MAERRWRPPLWLVLGGALGATLGLSLLGLVLLRWLGPIHGFRPTAAALAVAIAAATAVLGWLLLRLLLRPMLGLRAYAVAVRRGGAAQPPQSHGTPELHDLAVAVTGMARTLQDREASIRAYTDHVTHEIRGPVAVVRAATEMLADAGQADPDLLERIDGAAARIEAQLAALRAMAAAREPRHQGRATLGAILGDLRDGHPDLELRAEGTTTPLPMAAEGLRLVVGHLLRNAAEAGARRVTLRATARRLTVQDDGDGILPDDAARLFEPFFTTRRASGGTGMGLPIVAATLAAHGGRIEAVPTTDGTAFTIDF